MPTQPTIRASNGVTLASRVLADLTAKSEPVTPPASTYPDEAAWQELDPATLTPSLRKSYKQYVEVRREAASLKAAFEQAMSEAAALPPQGRLIFGYNFGKLSIAIVSAASASKRKGTSKQPQSLADFLAAQALTDARR